MIEQLKQLPKDLQEIYLLANKCTRKLISEGETPEAAEDMVLEILKECEYDLLNSKYSLVKGVLIGVFLK